MPLRWPENFLLRSPPRGLRLQLRSWTDPVRSLLERPRADWLLSVLGEGGADRERLARSCADCARRALSLASRKESPLLEGALDLVALWSPGDPSTREILSLAHQILRVDPKRSPSQAARAVSAALDSTTQPTAAHTAARHAAVALAAAQGAPSTPAWLAAYEQALSEMGQYVCEQRWSMHAPDPELLRCRPELQVAWDLASERVQSETLSTRQVLVAFTYRNPLEVVLGKIQGREQELLHPISERIGGADDPDALLAEIRSMLSRAP